MLIYDKGYITIKNKYILPLSEYWIKYPSLEKTNIKSLLASNDLIKVTKSSDSGYLLEFNNDALFKAVLGDIQLMYIRMLMQEQDSKSITECYKKVTANWNIVTAYYHGFFSASLLLRLCFRGNIYLDAEAKKNLEKTISELIEERISLNNNLIYSVINRHNYGYVLSLKNCDSNTHKVVWEEVNNLLEEILLLTNKNSDEYTILNLILNINKRLSPKYPSQLRNRVNYQMLYGKKYLDNKIFHLTLSDDWVKTFQNFNDDKLLDDDNLQASLFCAYDKYIEIFAKKLVFDYYNIRGNQNGVIKKLNEKFDNKIEMKELPFCY